MRRISAWLVGGICLLGLPRLVIGQVCRPGELRVFVKDSQESAVSGVKVRLGSDSKEIGIIETQPPGIAGFPNVPCGVWTISASREGFEDRSKTVELKGQPFVEATVTLMPGMVRSSTEVTESAPRVEQSAAENNELQPKDVKTLPGNPATVTEVLPLVPGVARTPQGELVLDGAGEQRSAFVVNQSDVTDPSTGKFGQTVPLDAIETVNVLNVPFLAQYGRFTQTVVAVETKRGGDKWHADLNDPFPDFRIRSYHMQGIRNETPRFTVGGPLIANRLFFNTAFVYIIDKVPSRTLGYPFNESKKESINSFTQLDYILTQSQILTFTAHISPQHINFVNPDFFNPQAVTPTYSQKNYVENIAHHLSFWGGLLDSSFSLQRFKAFVGAQGPGDMIVTPSGNQGNFFAPQNRDARRSEWLEHWTPAPATWAGQHQLKVGNSLTRSTNSGQFSYQPVNIYGSLNQLIERIDFENHGLFSRVDLEATAFVQDHWTLNPRISFDYGARVEHQRLASSLRVAPRAGFAWSPFANERTVARFGWGDFYDHIPLDVYSFSRYPSRTETFYGPNGAVIGSPIPFVNVIGNFNGPRSFFVNREQVAGAFSPRGATFNAQIEHRFSRALRVRAGYLDNRSVGLINVGPQLVDGVNRLVLNGDGSAHYRHAEITGKWAWNSAEQLNFSYVHASDRGTLNGFDSYLGDFPVPVIQPSLYSNLPGSLPNRVVVWGNVNPHIWALTLAPTIEYRNGFPYADYDQYQNFAGTPYENRFRHFLSVDARVSRDFKVSPKYSLRLSLTGFNITNHFNPLLIHSNIADPQYGTAFGNYKRRYRFDFDVIF